jgi:hypothetical protein
LRLRKSHPIATAVILVSFVLRTSTSPRLSDPQPLDATRAILAVFDKYELVGLGAGHGFKDLDDFILSLIRNPAFPDKANDIVVECGNRLYQDTLDRYISGEDVPTSKLQLVWRNTTQQMCSLSRSTSNCFPW